MAGYFAFDQAPEVQLEWTFSRHDLERAKQILAVNTPENTAEGAITTLSLTQNDLNVAADYLLNRYVDSASRITLLERGLKLSTSISTPSNPFGGYLNISLLVENRFDEPYVTQFRVGRITIPDALSGWLLRAVIEHSPLRQYYVLAGKHVKELRFTDDSLLITYRWDNDAYSQARKFLTADADESLLTVYQRKLAEITGESADGPRLALITVLRPLFKLAYLRSGSGSAVAENHALLIVLGDYVNAHTMPPPRSSIDSAPKPGNRTIRLHMRKDMAQHFVASAVLTATGNEKMAGIIGITKEIDDAQHGSGFSFIDLAADQAGSQFGKMAVASEKQARKLQKVITNAENEDVFMPDVRDLPEHIPKHEFAKLYGGLDGAKYQRLIEQIDARILRCPLYAG